MKTKTILKIVWMIVFFLLSAYGLYKTIQLDNTYESFKWCCFTALGFTLGVIILWSLIHRYFEK